MAADGTHTHPASVDTAGGRHRVVVVGAGFGGLFATKFLRRSPVDVVLIDRTNHHLFQPLLYQVATGVLSPGKIAPATRDVLRRHDNVTVELGDVTGFDLDGRTVTVAHPDGERRHAYDSLVVAAGVSQSYFGHDEFAEHAPGIKTLQDALTQRARILGAFERAELETDPTRRRALLTFVVVGGGPTGVEIAGQIAELSRRALKRNFRRVDPRQTRIVLYDGGPEILASFGDDLSERASAELSDAGVEIHARTRVIHVDEHGVVTQGPDGTETRLDADTTIWAAGVQASPLGAMLADQAGAELDRAGRVEVLPDCSLPGHRDVFVIGDMMALDDLPGVAEVAMQTGIHVARTITRRVRDGVDSGPFTYRDLGSMAAVSNNRAIVSFRGLHLWGRPGWIVWLFVHLAFLTGFKNRFFAVTDWLSSFVGHGRNERAIPGHLPP